MMVVKFTADQFHALTRFKLDQLWPERSGRARMEVTVTIDQLQAILQRRHEMDIEATREGEDTSELDLVDRGDIEVTREGENTPELDQVDRGDIEATREGETRPKLDQVDRGTSR